VQKVKGRWVKKPHGKYYRRRIRDPSQFRRGTLRLTPLKHGRRLIVGRLRRSGRWAVQAELETPQAHAARRRRKASRKKKKKKR